MQIDRVGMGDMLLKALAEMLVTWWWLIAAVLALGILLQFASRRLSRRREGSNELFQENETMAAGSFQVRCIAPWRPEGTNGVHCQS